jgi:hypothetical protein
MSENKGLVVSNVSGSERGTIHSNAALISVTGAISIARTAANNAHAMPGEDVFFHVAGTPNDNLTVSVFGGDVVLSGSLSVEGSSDSSFNNSLRVGNNLIVTDNLTVTGSTHIKSTLTLGNETGTFNIGDPDELSSDALEIRTNGVLRLSGSVQVPLDLSVVGNASFLDGIEAKGDINVSTGSVLVDASHSINTNVLKSLVPSGTISFVDSLGDRGAYLNAPNVPLAISRVNASGSEVTGKGFNSITRTTDPGVYSLTFDVPAGTSANDIVVLIGIGDQSTDPGVLVPAISIASETCTITVRSYDMSGAAANISFSILVYIVT